jgi:hypothetical protein
MSNHPSSAAETWSSATADVLETILLSLNNPIGDERWWKIRTDMIFLCLLELTTLVDEHTPVIDPDSETVRSAFRSIPHLRRMALAMVRNDGIGATEAGEAALGALRPLQSFIERHSRTLSGMLLANRSSEPQTASWLRLFS